ncbi:MAG: alanine--tRNA ligase-related protein, partial [Gallicola sp.]|nr:alanine--tRNA ligase-related protein [Gallicola sp.]
VLSGEDAFKLYDTYGFPLDLTKEILEEQGLSVDEDEFNNQMQEQRERARAARTSIDNVGWSNQSEETEITGDETEFIGYVTTEGFAKVQNIILNNEQVEKLSENDKGIVILDATPFYGQSGGQIGDTGRIYTENMEARVYDTKKTKSGIILHLVEVLNGELELNQKVVAKVDEDRRKAITRNHSATHLLHRALKEVLGDHVNQAGSEVTDTGFRFDFTHFAALTKEELAKIESMVNEDIYKEVKSDIYELPIEEAFDDGAIGLFEDKYKDLVRIVSFPGISKELCGGNHVEKTSDIGMFKITSETGIASGVRRIEAMTGKSVYDYLKKLEEEENSILSVLKANKTNLLDKAKTLMAENKELSKEVEALKKANLKENLDELLSTKKDIGGINVISSRVDAVDMENLRNLADEIRDKVGNAVVVLGGVNEEKLSFVATVSKDLIAKGLKAGNIVKEVA